MDIRLEELKAKHGIIKIWANEKKTKIRALIESDENSSAVEVLLYEHFVTDENSDTLTVYAGDDESELDGVGVFKEVF